VAGLTLHSTMVKRTMCQILCYEVVHITSRFAGTAYKLDLDRGVNGKREYCNNATLYCPSSPLCGFNPQFSACLLLQRGGRMHPNPTNKKSQNQRKPYENSR